ncbi:glycoside hydrolase family 32 protein [Bacillus massiliigorillae]|uniref:glycoside hydrolase family 32 protein n=1 Tax=Bacillus massiliigorillae TaxID=1243664 RepID=UPI00039ADB9D|nr:sucrose-6-phosphate hydrolase [Bacillus massiliigorillae]
MEWTRERRYRRLQEASAEELKQLEMTVQQCEWRQHFHIQPPTGLLNDPNGFCYYNGEYHLFYQWFPLGPVHGLKYWYHTSSKDLVNWNYHGVGIEPGYYYDSHGAYSGSGIEHDGKLHLLYTGNVRDKNWVRYPYQALAIMDEDYIVKKQEKAVIESVPIGYTDHYRDPKVWKENDTFYMIIGAQRENETGCAVLYSSLDLKEWKFEGELETNLKDFGFMWECPDYMVLNDKGVFIFSPQGVEPSGDNYQNIYQSGYIIGNPLTMPNRTFKHGEFHELDRGFDFYAPQTTLDPQGRRILVGWMGLPEIAYPTDRNDWAHCLTVPRELTVKGDKLIQKPVKELEQLRTNEQKVNGMIQNETVANFDLQGTVYEMICEMTSADAHAFGIEFRAGETNKTVITYNRKEKKIILDRSQSGEAVGEEFGTTRACYMDAETIKFHMFVDTSSVEVFINDGEEVFTARIFPNKEDRNIRFFSYNGTVQFDARKWDITK